MSLVHVDERIGRLAAGRDAVVTWDELRALGLGRGAIDWRVRRGLLHRMHPGVYTWGVPNDTPWARARGAALACGTGAFVSHHSALGLHEIRPHADGPVDITVVARRVRRSAIRVHHVVGLHREDRREMRGIWVSSPARALLEAAPELTARELAAAVEQAQVKRLVTKRELSAAMQRAGRRPGVVALRPLVAERAFTRSQAERRLVVLLRAAGLPEPAFNAHVEGFEVDVLWSRERVVLEFDSYGFHATRAAFERDRRRSAALTRGRHLVLRTTWSELTEHSHALVARTAEALALSRAARG
jgi:very-short-patch-repair endonuclease